MRTSMAVLAASCLAVAACAGPAAAQVPYNPAASGGWPYPAVNGYPGVPVGYPGGAAGYPGVPVGYPGVPAGYPGGPVVDPGAPADCTEGCGPSCSEGGCYIGRCPRDPCVWGDAEFLLGFRKSRQVPALVTTSVPGTSLADAGVLGLPSTSILFGGDGLEDNPQPGVRAEVGVWLDRGRRWGVGGSFIGLQESSVGFSATSDGSTILARPIFNALHNREGSQLVAFPGIVRGTVEAENSNNVYGAEVFLRKQIGWWPTCFPPLFDFFGLRSFLAIPGTQRVTILEHAGIPGGYGGGGIQAARCDFIVGYQFSRVDDSLRVSNALVNLDPASIFPIGTTLDAFDDFDARNEFHGAAIGLRYTSSYGPWSINMLGKVGLGNMHQSVSVFGQTVITVPNVPPVVLPGGLLTQPSNIGFYDRDRFGVIPEARFTLNYNLTRCLSVGVGYEFMYWNTIAFAGEQVDRRVDVTQVVPFPQFPFRESDSFIHAVTFLVQLNR